MRASKWAACVLLAVVAAGCEKPLPPTVKLGGKVTLDGKPLPQGVVKFYPSDKQGASAVMAPITDGLYLAPVVPVGSYRVAFDVGALSAASEPVTVDSTYNAPDPKAKKNPIPEKYRQPSLPADASADNPALNFDLVSK